MSESKATEIVPIEISAEALRTKIYTIRGQRVMLDADLAEIYGYSTKAFNQQVKNNIDKFEEDFRFQLTWDEVEDLSRSKNLTLNKEGLGKNRQDRGTELLSWSMGSQTCIVAGFFIRKVRKNTSQKIIYPIK